MFLTFITHNRLCFALGLFGSCCAPAIQTGVSGEWKGELMLPSCALVHTTRKPPPPNSVHWRAHSSSYGSVLMNSMTMLLPDQMTNMSSLKIDATLQFRPSASSE